MVARLTRGSSSNSWGVDISGGSPQTPVLFFLIEINNNLNLGFYNVPGGSPQTPLFL